MVRHIEVRLKQQKQQSVGRSLLALEDTIRQTEVRRLRNLPNLDLFRFSETHGCVHFGCAGRKADLKISSTTNSFCFFVFSKFQSLDLELRDLETAVKEEVEAAEQLLKSQPKDVPPQLLLALEKDWRSLSRGYEAARALSDDILQNLKTQKDSYKVHVWRKPPALVVWT